MPEQTGNVDWNDVGFTMLLAGAMVLGALWVLLRQIMFKRRNRGRRADDQSPLAILTQRYARGEIAHEEFEQKKRDLEEHSGA